MSKEPQWVLYRWVLGGMWYDRMGLWDDWTGDNNGVGSLKNCLFVCDYEGGNALGLIKIC